MKFKKLESPFIGDFGNVKEISMTGKARDSINDISRRSSVLKRELGGVMCYSMSPGKITILDLLPIDPAILQESTFSYNMESARVQSSFHCNNEKPLIFHTHPSGNPSPSEQDRVNSIQNGSIGCVGSGSGLTCYAGSRDLVVNDL